MTSREMLERLIAFDTTSCYSNLELIDWVRDYLDGYGITSALIHDVTKNKANLHAVIGPAEEPGIVLSGHTDVVPVEGQEWNSDPFKLHVHDGLWYGRGTSDMKGFIAVALSLVPSFVERPLSAPIHLALSYDEELGCLGAHSLVEHVVDSAVMPKMCIVGEPTGMKPITGHKGICDYECTVHGKEMHSSLAPYAVNAVEAAAELITFVRSIARRMETEGSFNTAYDPPFTTLQTGVVKGGTAINIVPNHCNFCFEIRNIPEVNAQDVIEEIRQYAFKQIEPRMKDIDPKSGIKFEIAAEAPAFSTPDNDPVVDLVLSLTGANETSQVSFATEAGVFNRAGMPTVVCGPGHIAQAHKPDEFVAEDQIVKCEHFLTQLVDRTCRVA